jgi:GTP-binding protein HflX
VSKQLIDLAAPQERAVLVGAPVKRSNAKHHVQEHLDELARLADTAGALVVGTLTQQLDRPDPSTYIGRGKVEELKQLLADTQATLVIFDDELSPAQGKNLEGELGKRTIDRAELILDIFAVRARSAEARMQVELAQLEYSLPRLVRMWTHLEKFRGGIGVRGPGETQLETDRRLVGHRIRLLKERLADVAKAREVQRSGRQGRFKAALVGYTNAGKSSILRAISQASEVFVEDRLFATLDPLTREVDLGDHQSALLTDTVGFIRKLPHHLVASFRATLEEVREADLLFHVIDASHPSWEEQRLVVDEVLAELGVAETPTRYVFNKMDALPPEQREALRARIENLAPGSIFVSAREEERLAAAAPPPGAQAAAAPRDPARGLEPMRAVLREALRAQKPEVELHIPMTHGKLLAEVHRMGEVLSSAPDEDEGVMVIRGRFDAAALARLERDGAERR